VRLVQPAERLWIPVVRFGEAPFLVPSRCTLWKEVLPASTLLSRIRYTGNPAGAGSTAHEESRAC